MAALQRRVALSPHAAAPHAGMAAVHSSAASHACPWFAGGACKHGDRCFKPHVKLCRHFAASGCKHGEKCHFAHVQPKVEAQTAPFNGVMALGALGSAMAQLRGGPPSTQPSGPSVVRLPARPTGSPAQATCSPAQATSSYTVGQLVQAKFADTSKTWKRARVVAVEREALVLRFEGFSDKTSIPRARVRALEP